MLLQGQLPRVSSSFKVARPRTITVHHQVLMCLHRLASPSRSQVHPNPSGGQLRKK